MRRKRFIESKCDRCGRATPARQNNTGDLFVLHEDFGPPLADQGDFCERCCERYSRDEWLAWFSEHRPDVLPTPPDAN